MRFVVDVFIGWFLEVVVFDVFLVVEIDVYFYIDDYVYEESCVVDDSKMDYCIFMFVFYRCLF